MDFQKIREKYEYSGIDISSFLDDPIQQLREWYIEAETHCPGRWFEPNGMALATTDLNGNVTVRWVLLKGIMDDGIRFFTNYESAKGKQLAKNSKAAVALYWPYLGRQVRIEGVTEKTSREVSEEYFRSRPRGSQLGALASRQSMPVPDRDQLDAHLLELTSRYEGQDVPLPDDWGGYLLKPTRVEFWQGRPNRVHDRIAYEQTGQNWRTRRLSP